MDEELAMKVDTDGFWGGSTAVTIIKQGDKLIIDNLGDSRAVLCTRVDGNHCVPLPLTIDLKPNIPSEALRIASCGGRVFSAEEDPGVKRIWMPEEDCPGLAMSRAFGDFCLKNCGLTSVPDHQLGSSMGMAQDMAWHEQLGSGTSMVLAVARFGMSIGRECWPGTGCIWPSTGRIWPRHMILGPGLGHDLGRSLSGPGKLVIIGCLDIK
ncbi:unnamed protein product [Lupinus luteus]|uniref:PPM-type phosphatase domain-containing protein n=1 Tax=Lupinus luteus TaxID=3873 RepID=A0AAV1WAG0_LUPLU